jgi:hypothetical protein
MTGRDALRAAAHDRGGSTDPDAIGRVSLARRARQGRSSREFRSDPRRRPIGGPSGTEGKDRHDRRIWSAGGRAYRPGPRPALVRPASVPGATGTRRHRGSRGRGRNRQVSQTHGCAIRSIDEIAIEASADIDAVIICTPTDTHADLIERFARAGKAVFCEKPVDLSLSRGSATAWQWSRRPAPSSWWGSSAASIPISGR